MRRISQTILTAALSVGAVCGSAAGASAGGPTGPAATSPDSKHLPAACLSLALRPSIVGSEGAAGSVYVTVGYKNVGFRSCTVNGFPSVAFANRFGLRIGAPAVHQSGQAKPVVLAPGKTATFLVRQVQAGIQEGCLEPSSHVRAYGLRIIPPGGGLPRILPYGAEACLRPSVQQLSVGPVTS
ncbi:DUF4232 domain-containing protein [Frankia sp. CNm7]|uniref:DUF4232 domain-containing protein n=1 Tax=Frankia nepalensis TaxID=1836974 RepID=A0A937UN99_9ACTN|nr:DUF4232 domain-containing protein [Frankia nepalensis]MBL7495453.1 DUF4232 domain-containing protein [Frankia nepalensis]MBL7510716.1 DUF4232 domain-containing protein [Frankia nepalensis]MBL7521679.1 DUF4232 domain-containing protein [Frankia nepalensis]MBL7626010.1 DUF4232 domain-containing protein [Frankia nepalensis]